MMKKKIIYVNFHRSNYKNYQEFELQQSNVLSFKSEIAAKFQIFYLLNNNLKLDECKKNVYLKSKQLNNLLFLIYCILFIRKQKAHFVIIHGLDYFIEGAFIKWFTGSKMILQHHAEKTYLRKKAILMPLADKWIDAYFFNGSEIAKPFLQKKCISSVNKIHQVAEGSSNFNPIPEKQISSVRQLVFIGRLNENKNLITLLKAISILKTKRSNFNLSIYYTTNELEQELKTYSEKNTLNEFVKFKGAVSQIEIETVLNQSDIFVSCSLYEGSGYSLIEALACGVFPVVSHIPAFDFLLEGLNEKEQFDPMNETELADKLHKILNLEYTDTIKHSVRNHFEKKCSNKAIALQIESVLSQLT